MTKDERLRLRDSLFSTLKNNKIISQTETRTRITKMIFLQSFLKTHPDFAEDYRRYVAEFRSESEALYCIVHSDDMDNHVCPVCSSLCKFFQKYMKSCSGKSCRDKLFLESSKKTFMENYGVSNPNKVVSVRKKIKSTNLDRYGCENPMQNENVRNRTIQTNLDRYGCENPMQNEDVQARSRATMVERYGVECAFQSQELRKKGIDTCIQRYGCENPMQNEDVQARSRATMVERYGVEYSAQSAELLAKMQQTMLERYGYSNPNQVPEIREKTIATNLERYGSENPMGSAEVVERMLKTRKIKYGIFDPISPGELEEMMGGEKIDLSRAYSDASLFPEIIKKISQRKHRLLGLREIASLFGVSPEAVKRRCQSLGLLDLFAIRDVPLEVEFTKLLDSEGVEYKRHDKTVIAPQEIDFLIPSLGIGFEINDTRSHNILEKDENYHKNKSALSSRKNIRLIHIWGWEMEDAVLWERVSRWVGNICSRDKRRVFARKCEVRKVDIKEEKEFLERYHLQGYRKSEICLGLYYNNELVQLMSFCKPRYTEKFSWELLRLCTKYGYIVVGGSRKLLHKFASTHNGESLVSYCDLSKFRGDVYESLGFHLESSPRPQAMWYNPETGLHFSQSSLVRLGADKLIGTNFGRGTDNEEIAFTSGYRKIFNCGTAVYSMIL